MSASAHSNAPHYFVPHPSRWPMIGSIALLMFGLSMGGWVNGAKWGPYLFICFLALFTFTLVGWFREAAIESEGGLYNQHVDLSYRWGMSWFIFSEVMFFAAFFGALFYARVITMPGWATSTTKCSSGRTSARNWPNVGPAGIVEAFQTIGPWPIPTINTALLLTSGVTLTVAHHALTDNERGKVIRWMFATIALGVAVHGLPGL